MKKLDLTAKRFKALGHPVRLGMALKLAEEPDTCACDFADVFRISQPMVSQHLKVLRDAKLVQTRRSGTQIYYSLDPATTRDLAALVGNLSKRRLRRAS